MAEKIPPNKQHWFTDAFAYADFTNLTPCSTCEHRDPDDSLRCHAFPGGIPKGILAGDFKHDEPFPGDHGILYKRRVE